MFVVMLVQIYWRLKKGNNKSIYVDSQRET